MKACRQDGRSRRAVAIPMVMGFAFLAGVFVVTIMSIRVEDKRQNLMTFQQLKSYYMAQAAIQHALLKIRILPNEVYDVSALSRGICPLLVEPPDSDGTVLWPDGLDYFISDITTDGSAGVGGIPLQLAGTESASWSYRIDEARALTTFMKIADAANKKRKVNVLELDAVGTIQDKLITNTSGATTQDKKTRSERITKVIQITRSSL
jgi:hypothetical protein